MLISAMYSSPSKSPGTSPEAKSAFIRSKNAAESRFDSSNMKHIFSYLQPTKNPIKKNIFRSYNY